MDDRTERIAVVGGGLAGLAAAEALVRAGRRVRVYEASARWGGLIGSRYDGDLLLESGPDGFFAGTPTLEALVDRLALRSEVVEARDGWAGLVRDGRVLPLPGHLWNGVPYRRLEILRAAGLGFGDRLRLLREPRVPLRRGAGGPESLDALLVRRLGPGAARRLVGPLLAGVHAGRAEELEAETAVGPLVEAERSGSNWLAAARRAARASGSGRRRPLRSFTDGMGELPDRLAAWLADVGAELCPQTAVRSIERDDAGWRLRTGSGADAGPFARVILAVPPAALAVLLAPLAAEAAAVAASIETAGARLVHLAAGELPAGRRARLHGAIVPVEEPGPISAFTVASAKWPDRAPRSMLLVRASLRPGADADAARPFVARYLGLRTPPALVGVEEHPDAFPVATLGHAARIAHLRGLVADLDGVEIAGAAYDGVGLGSVLAAAERLAR